MKPITFTNNLSPELIKWMEEYSTRQKLTRRAVLEKALNNLKDSERQNEYAESFKRASLDLELKNMAEEGMSDYSKQLSNLEK